MISRWTAVSQATTELEGRTPNRVFVLGAGFTRAFVPRAPLLVDDYNGQLLKERFSGFMRTSQILENEIRRHERGWIDLERLMTRLDGRMPFDATEVEPQLALLL